MADEIISPMQPDAETGEVVETAAPAEAEVALPAEEVDNGPDFEALRDEKCIPVARAMFADVAEHILPTDGSLNVNHGDLVLSLLQKGLAADLNMTTENPYVFQLMLGMLSGLNTTIQGCTMVPLDEAKYGRVAVEILKLVSDANVTVGAVTPDQTKADFAPIKDQVNAIFARENLNVLEVKYIMDMIFQAYSALNNAYSSSTEASMKKAEEKLWGVEDMTDITMSMVDKAMQGPEE